MHGSMVPRNVSLLTSLTTKLPGLHRAPYILTFATSGPLDFCFQHAVEPLRPSRPAVAAEGTPTSAKGQETESAATLGFLARRGPGPRWRPGLDWGIEVGQTQGNVENHTVAFRNGGQRVVYSSQQHFGGVKWLPARPLLHRRNP